MINEENPDMVFSTDLYNYNEIFISRLCSKINVTTFVSILSWDNLKYKGRIINYYDKFFVWGEMMKNDLLNHRPFLSPRSIIKSSSPQFSYHFEISDENVFSKRDLYKHFNFKNDRQYIFYCANTEIIFPDEPDLVEKIYLSIKSKEIDGNPYLLVRLHPFDRYERFDEIRHKYPKIKFFSSKKNYKNKMGPQYFSPKRFDLLRFSSALKHSALCVNMGSTVTIDALILNVPVVVIAFSENTSSVSHELISNIYNYGHYSELNINSIPFPKSYSDFKSIINSFLNGKKIDLKKTQQLVKHICGNPEKSIEIISKTINRELIR